MLTASLLRALLLLLAVGAPALPLARAANPYLAAQDEKPLATTFAGSEWGDEIGPKERPLTARVVTTRIASLAFAQVYRIEFSDVRSEGGGARQIAARHFVVTDGEIALLQDEDIDAAVARLKALTKAPSLPTPDLRAILRGSRKLTSDANSKSSVSVQGSRCTYRYAHSAGHFTTMIWQRGLGLIEYAQGRGARADGFRLRRSGGQGSNK
jgi:hypothetical protein